MAKNGQGKASRWRRLSIAAGAALGVAAVGGLDYLTGTEYRVYPLYFLPLSLGAWHLGRSATVATAVLCLVAWGGFNRAAGMDFSHPSVWAVNLLAQGVAFVTVGLLIVKLRDSVERMTGLSRTDPLTSLPNTRAFYDALRSTVRRAQRHPQPFTLAYIDLDNFKEVNDTLGHVGGDDLLRRVADLLRRELRSADMPARLGGDEFAVLLPETGPDAARAMIERIHSRLADALARSPGPVTASVGVVSFLEPTGEVEDFIRRADALMYAAKSVGKNRIWAEVVGETPSPASPAANREAPGRP